jgi:hypothetical protein
MPTAPKKVPVEVVAKAAALTKQYVVGEKPAVVEQPKLPRKITREKVVEALRRLHPMD